MGIMIVRLLVKVWSDFSPPLGTEEGGAIQWSKASTVVIELIPHTDVVMADDAGMKGVGAVIESGL